MRQNTKFGIVHTAIVTSLAAALLVGGAVMPANAEDDDDDTAFDVKILRNVLKSIGVRRGDEGIEYRERSPLVVPPSRNLPPPQAASTAPPSPAWPVDPDQKRSREAKAAAANQPRSVPDIADRSRPQLPSEYGRKEAPSADSRPDGKERPDPSKPMSPAQLEAKSFWSGSWLNKEEYGTFGGEPPRTSLTEPPVGYRSPSPNQPYGVGKEKWDYKPVDKQEMVR